MSRRSRTSSVRLVTKVSPIFDVVEFLVVFVCVPGWVPEVTVVCVIAPPSPSVVWF